MKVGVAGAGGVGGYFGGRLALAGVEVALLARGARLAAVRERGLHIRGVVDDFIVRVAASDDPEIGPCDFVLFCVKSYDTDQAAALLEPLLEPETAVVSLQNGVDNEEKIAARIGSVRVLGGAAFILAHIAEPGVIEQTTRTDLALIVNIDVARRAVPPRTAVRFYCTIRMSRTDMLERLNVYTARANTPLVTS